MSAKERDALNAWEKSSHNKWSCDDSCEHGARVTFVATVMPPFFLTDCNALFPCIVFHSTMFIYQPLPKRATQVIIGVPHNCLYNPICPIFWCETQDMHIEHLVIQSNPIQSTQFWP